MASSRSARAIAWGATCAASLALTLGLAGPASTAPEAPPATGAVAVTLTASAPAPEVEGQFISRINGLRASKGLRQLQISGDLVGVARRWTERMVQAGQISHNPNLASEVPGAWTKLGENVGVGNDVDGLMQAFINSPAHYRNLVDPEWTHLGVGVTLLADGRMFTTHNFMTLGAAPPPPPPPPPPSPPPTSPPPPQPTPAPPSTGAPGADGAGSGDAPTTTTTVPPAPKPTADRVSAVLDPLRSLES
jgi:uncharacterized protein YkwD